MNLQQFVSLAKQVRTAQKKYYAHPGSPRDDSNKARLLSESKTLEARLDQVIADFEGKQTSLGI